MPGLELFAVALGAVAAWLGTNAGGRANGRATAVSRA